jgi:DNA-binding transcriptional ArsR family regulator
MPQQLKSIDRVFRALADPTRRAVLKELTKGKATCSELAEPYSMALPSFMQHIDMLEDAGLIRSKKTGRVRICEVAPGKLKPAKAWIAELQKLAGVRD